MCGGGCGGGGGGGGSSVTAGGVDGVPTRTRAPANEPNKLSFAVRPGCRQVALKRAMKNVQVSLISVGRACCNWEDMDPRCMSAAADTAAALSVRFTVSVGGSRARGGVVTVEPMGGIGIPPPRVQDRWSKAHVGRTYGRTHGRTHVCAHAHTRAHARGASDPAPRPRQSAVLRQWWRLTGSRDPPGQLAGSRRWVRGAAMGEAG